MLEIRLEGELVKSFDMGEIFRNLEFPDDCHPPPGYIAPRLCQGDKRSSKSGKLNAPSRDVLLGWIQVTKCNHLGTTRM
jgi:hypothetical protein